MLQLFKPKHRSLLGVDISSTSVKMIEISSNKDQYTVKGYGSLVFPEHVMDGVNINVDAVAASIRQLMASERFSCKDVALAVPDSSTISRIIQINEGLNDDEIEELVVMEADKYIPYSLDEISLDFQVLGPSSKNTAMLDVLLVASKVENVNHRVEAVTHAGLEVKIVDVESFAVERAAKWIASDMPEGGINKIVAIVDIGAVHIHFFVLHNLKLIFSHEEEFSGKQLIQAIAQEYGIKLEEAIAAIEHGTLSKDYQNKILQPFQKTVLLQVKRGLQFFFSTGQYTTVDQIVLAGGVARYPNIVQLLQEQINIPTTIANPFVNMNVARNVNPEKLKNDAPSLMIACGLALRA